MLEKIEHGQLMRYGYAGFLCASLLVVGFPDEAKRYIDSAGNVVGPLSILAMGGFVYTFFRYVLGDNLLFHITHLIHYLGDLLFNGNAPTSPTGYLGSKKRVPLGQRRQAYTDITNELFQLETKQRLKTDHAEINIMYLTSVVGGIVLALLFYQSKTNGSLFQALSYGAPLIWIAAVIMDIKQHKKECRMLMAKDGGDTVDEFLKRKGYRID